MLIRRQLLSIADRMLITVDEAKAHIAETGTFRDGIIEAAILAGYNYISGLTDRAILTEKWRIYHTHWKEIKIPRGQLQSVQSVKYLDTDGTEQTVSADDYEVIGVGGDEGYISFSDDFERPELYDHEPIRVEFTAGWLPDTMPEEITLSALFYVEMVITENVTPDFVQSFFDDYTLRWY